MFAALAASRAADAPSKATQLSGLRDACLAPDVD